MVSLSRNPYKGFGIKKLNVRLTFKDEFRHPEDIYDSFYKWASKTYYL